MFNDRLSNFCTFGFVTKCLSFPGMFCYQDLFQGAILEERDEELFTWMAFVKVEYFRSWPSDRKSNYLPYCVCGLLLYARNQYLII